MTSEKPKLPWTTETSLPFGEQPRIHDADGRLVAVIGNAETDRQDEWEANAEFIVRAVNSHDDMLAVLKAARGVIEAAGDFEPTPLLLHAYAAGNCRCAGCGHR